MGWKAPGGVVTLKRKPGTFAVAASKSCFIVNACPLEIERRVLSGAGQAERSRRGRAAQEDLEGIERTGDRGWRPPPPRRRTRPPRAVDALAGRQAAARPAQGVLPGQVSAHLASGQRGHEPGVPG